MQIQIINLIQIPITFNQIRKNQFIFPRKYVSYIKDNLNDFIVNFQCHYSIFEKR